MLDFSWSHILIVLIVALVVVGPKDLPKLMRIIGRWAGKARAMADRLRKTFDEIARESELDELRQEIVALRAHRPLADIPNTLHQSILPPSPMEAVGPVNPADKAADARKSSNALLTAPLKTASDVRPAHEIGVPSP